MSDSGTLAESLLWLMMEAEYEKRKYKIYPDFSERDWGWIAKVYERSGPSNRWTCISKEPKEGLFFGPGLVVERAHEEAKENNGIVCFYDRNNDLVEWIDYEFSVVTTVNKRDLVEPITL